MKLTMTNFLGLLFVLTLAFAMSIAVVPQSVFAESDSDDDSLETEDSSDVDEFEVEVEIQDDGGVEVSFEFGGTSYSIALTSSEEADVIDAVEVVMNVDSLDVDFEAAIVSVLADELVEEEANNEDEK